MLPPLPSIATIAAASDQVRTVPVQTRLIPLSELRVPAPRREDISSIEASLRLDAVASAGAREAACVCAAGTNAAHNNTPSLLTPRSAARAAAAARLPHVAQQDERSHQGRQVSKHWSSRSCTLYRAA